MCELCGCDHYIRQGQKAVLQRALEVVKELKLTERNLADYENTELISSIIAPFGSRNDDVFKAAEWISDLHASPGLVNVNTRYGEYASAFKDIFELLPVQGDPKQIVTAYHQLEQLNKELGDADLVAIDPSVRNALQALRRVHDDPERRENELRQRYGL